MCNIYIYISTMSSLKLWFVIIKTIVIGCFEKIILVDQDYTVDERGLFICQTIYAFTAYSPVYLSRYYRLLLDALFMFVSRVWMFAYSKDWIALLHFLLCLFLFSYIFLLSFFFWGFISFPYSVLSFCTFIRVYLPLSIINVRLEYFFSNTLSRSILLSWFMDNVVNDYFMDLK